MSPRIRRRIEILIAWGTPIAVTLLPLEPIAKFSLYFIMGILSVPILKYPRVAIPRTFELSPDTEKFVLDFEHLGFRRVAQFAFGDSDVVAMHAGDGVIAYAMRNTKAKRFPLVVTLTTRSRDGRYLQTSRVPPAFYSPMPPGCFWSRTRGSVAEILERHRDSLETLAALGFSPVVPRDEDVIDELERGFREYREWAWPKLWIVPLLAMFESGASIDRPIAEQLRADPRLSRASAAVARGSDAPVGALSDPSRDG